MTAAEMFADECLARGVEAVDASIDVGTATDPGRIGPSGTFRDVTGSKKPAPIMPRVRAAFDATRTWALAGRKVPAALVGFDVLIGVKS